MKPSNIIKLSIVCGACAVIAWMTFPASMVDASSPQDLLMGAGITSQYSISDVDIIEFYNKKGKHCMVAVRDRRPTAPLVLICEGY